MGSLRPEGNGWNGARRIRSSASSASAPVICPAEAAGRDYAPVTEWGRAVHEARAAQRMFVVLREELRARAEAARGSMVMKAVAGVEDRYEGSAHGHGGVEGFPRLAEQADVERLGEAPFLREFRERVAHPAPGDLPNAGTVVENPVHGGRAHAREPRYLPHRGTFPDRSLRLLRHGPNPTKRQRHLRVTS